VNACGTARSNAVQSRGRGAGRPPDGHPKFPLAHPHLIYPAKKYFTLKYLEKPLNGLKYLEFGVRPEARGRRPTDAGSGDPAYRVGDCFPAGHSRRASRGFGTMVPHATKMSKNVPQPPGRWRTSWPARGDNYGGDGRAVTRKSDVARTGHRAFSPRWASAGKTNAETTHTTSLALLGWGVKWFTYSWTALCIAGARLVAHESNEWHELSRLCLFSIRVVREIRGQNGFQGRRAARVNPRQLTGRGLGSQMRWPAHGNQRRIKLWADGFQLNIWRVV